MARLVSERSRIERLWVRDASFGDELMALPLRAAALAYRGALAARNQWWRWRARDAGITTISVGNLTVGGNSKTPFTIFLANRMQSRGLRVGIVSRGYNRAASGARAELVADGGKLMLAPDRAGDEPAMMARGFAGPIAVAKRRIDAIELLKSHTALDAVILDDGFQHTRLRRDLDLVLVSRERGFGNGRMLPAGPMREPLAALNRADAIVIVSSDDGGSSAIDPAAMERIQRRTVLRATVRPRSLVSAENGAWRESAAALTGRRVLAVSGLADPSRFHAMLREIDADLVGVLDFRDHHSYDSADWHSISAAARDVDVVVTTEKDLVKLERFPFPRDSLYALRLEVTMTDEDARALDTLVTSRVRTPPLSAAEEVSSDAG